MIAICGHRSGNAIAVWTVGGYGDSWDCVLDHARENSESLDLRLKFVLVAAGTEIVDSLNDFRDQVKLIFRIAPTLEVTREMRCIFGMIDAMTRDERVFPEMIDEARRKRIAVGAGVEASVVENLVCDFTWMRDKLKSMSKNLRSITE